MDNQLILEFDTLEENSISSIEYNLKHGGPLHVVFNQLLDFTSKNERPIVKASSQSIPNDIRSLHRVSKKNNLYDKVCPHFFTKDENIEPVWSKTLTYINKLRKFGRCMSPDFSIFENMVKEQRHWNSFRNKYLTALWQKMGIDVIPAPSWGKDSDYEYYMEGWPKHSLIAINSTGISNDIHNRHLFLDGYYAMIDILKPEHILRYGPYVEGEYSDISTYYPNDARKEVVHGY